MTVSRYLSSGPGPRNGPRISPMSIRSLRFLITALFLLAALLLPACSGADEESEPATPVVIEEGAEAHHEEDAEQTPEDVFPDKGEAATIEDLQEALSKVESYYFEQSVEYPEGQVFMQVWYKDGLMKLITSVSGYGLTESYYDYNNGTVVDYYPGAMPTAYGRGFDPAEPNAPKNPKLEDYSTADIIGSETVDRQLCQILETASGDKLWVGTKYGFPLRVEYTDSLGERYQVDYRNLSVNSVSDEEVTIPGDLQIVFNGD